MGIYAIKNLNLLIGLCYKFESSIFEMYFVVTAKTFPTKKNIFII